MQSLLTPGIPAKRRLSVQLITITPPVVAGMREKRQSVSVVKYNPDSQECQGGTAQALSSS
jgi:hypothetical protein